MRDPAGLPRRKFLKLWLLALPAIAVATRTDEVRAQQLDEKDSLAQSLGYRHDASQVDRKKFANYGPGQACAGCQQYQGKAADAWGPCVSFSGKQVNAKGWCAAFQKKA